MTTTNFVDQTTVIEASWLNDIDYLGYNIFTFTDGNTDLTINGNVIAAADFIVAGTFATQLINDNGSLLEISFGDSGQATPHSGSVVIIENNTSALINLLAGAAYFAGLVVGDSADNDVGQFYYSLANDNWTGRAGGVQSIQFDGNATAGNTRLLVWDVDNNTMERVSVGAADSGGAGYKVLRIPN